MYFYKTSGKFHQSIIATFAAMTFYFSVLSPAHLAGEADAAFTQQNPQHQSRPQRGRGFFGCNPNNDGSGPGKPNDDGSDGDDGGIPKYLQLESVEFTQERVERIDDHLRQMSEVSDSVTESENEDDFAEYLSAVTVKEALELPDVRTYEEAKKYAETNVPERLNVNEQHHISGLMAAKKTPHAPEIGLNPVDYGMKAEHVTLIRGMGL
jgi:hypothetical protein